MTPEAKTKERIKRMLVSHGVYYFMPATHGYGRSGVPDFVVCANGRFLAIEAKAGRGKTTALQEREMTHIRAAGGRTLVVYDTDDHFDMLRTTLQEMLDAPYY